MIRSSRAALAALIVLAAPWTARAQSDPALVFRSVRVFDGYKVIAETDVLVRGGIIISVGRALKAPDGATVVDGRGKTLLPGLIDAHTHTWADAGRQALIFGVTTELDQFTEYKQAAAWRAEQSAGKATARADVYSAGTLVTAPKGHGTEYGMTIPTITSPDSARAFVDARIAEGSDWIKVVYDDGKSYGMSLPTIDLPTMKAVIDAAHARKKLAVVHVGSVQGARDAIDAGADGLVHLAIDRAPDEGFGALVAKRKAFVIPTLTVLKAVTGEPGGGPLVDDRRVAGYLMPQDITQLKQAFPVRPGSPPKTYAGAEAAVRQLRAAGVPILAGTDAGNPGTAHGVALHREVELLVGAGLTPNEALAAATSAPAKAFRLPDRGTIAKGQRANLLLVNGAPTVDITATRDIARIWKQGVAVDRQTYAAAAAEARASIGSAPKGLGDGCDQRLRRRIDDLALRLWLGRVERTNGRRKSSADISVADGGAGATAKSLVVRGTIADAVPFAWAGAMFSPGMQQFAPVNLSAKSALSFRAKGDGQTYRVMIFAQSKGYQPLTKTFVAGPEWTEFVFPFVEFNGIDGKDIMAVVWAGGPKPGAFEFRIDDVRVK